MRGLFDAFSFSSEPSSTIFDFPEIDPSLFPPPLAGKDSIPQRFPPLKKV